MIDLKGKVALVVGGTSGIGKAAAIDFGKAGSMVVATSSNADRVAETVGELKQIGVQTIEVVCDATEPESVRRTISAIEDQWGRLDILMNCQGIHHKKHSEEVENELFADVITVNLNSVFTVCREAYPLLKASQGCIINLASMASFMGLPHAAAYTASKGGVAQLTKALAIDWAVDSIRCNAIAPGWVVTPLTAPTLAQEQYSKPILARIPMKRLGAPKDVSSVALFLASPLASYITGAVIPVDGGVLAGI